MPKKETSNIVKFDGLTCNDVPANDVLEGAMDKLTECVVIGVTQDGETWVSSTSGYVPLCMFLVDQGKREMWRIYEGQRFAEVSGG